MTTSTHTPGPWTVEIFDHVTSITAGPDSPHGKLLIAEVCSDPVEANARLIAAAPELLEACIQACDYLSDDEEDESAVLFEYLWTVIRKAQGSPSSN